MTKIVANEGVIYLELLKIILSMKDSTKHQKMNLLILAISRLMLYNYKLLTKININTNIRLKYNTVIKFNLNKSEVIKLVNVKFY